MVRHRIGRSTTAGTILTCRRILGIGEEHHRCSSCFLERGWRELREKRTREKRELERKGSGNERKTDTHPLLCSPLNGLGCLNQIDPN